MTGYDIGYKKPPHATRYKKGKSGNPKGRPKKPKSDDIGQALLTALDHLVTVHENGRPERVTIREAIVRKVLHEATMGDLRAMDDVGLLMKVPGDYQSDRYVFAGHWGVPPVSLVRSTIWRDTWFDHCRRSRSAS
jgi:hypothetical protein